MELFIKYPVDVQEELILRLVQFAKSTEFGEQYDFTAINTYKDFAARVPIQRYESFEPLIERCRKGEQNLFWPTKIKWFAKSSGTTNAKSKFIPVSDEAIEYCHLKAGKDMLCLYINNNEDTELFNGKGLRLGGSSAIYEDNNSYFGDLSAIIIENMPFWADFSSAPRQETALMTEWETKMEAIINETIHENITSLVGVPSWMLVLLNKVLEKTGKDNILEVWPNLEVYFHGGVNFNPYREQYKKLIPKKDFKYYETYNASEGFFALQDINGSYDLLLMLDYGIFYEFIPMSEYKGENSIAIPLSEVRKGVNYAMVISTNGGLWRYLIGDTVKFTSLKPFFMDGKKQGSHEWVIEFAKAPKNLKYFTELLDNALKSINSDYEAKRYNNMTLVMPTVHSVKKGLFYSWLKEQGKLGGQHKVPRLSNSRDFVEKLLSL